MTLEYALNLLEVDKFPEGPFSTEWILQAMEEMRERYGEESIRQNRKLHLAQLEQLQTF